MKHTLDTFKDHFGDKLHSVTAALAETTLETAAENGYAVLQDLRDKFGFEQLIDLCGIDYAAYGHAEWDVEASSSGFSRGVERDLPPGNDAFPARFAVVYHLLSIEHNQRIRVRVFTAGDVPQVDSVIPIWSSANWFEREAFDLYGILFNGHPDLRRLLTDYGFIGHPFRKDFPLSGHVEMRFDPEKGRVVYEAVTVEPRVLVPKVIRQDNRYSDA
jgi:NADH-quinone oxidoreductase subunit C